MTRRVLLGVSVLALLWTAACGEDSGGAGGIAQETPEPDPQPEALPDPDQTPQPDPQPEVQPDPEPAPQPDPEPAPQPDPEPAPEPDPMPEPDPDPQPDPEPEFLPGDGPPEPRAYSHGVCPQITGGPTSAEAVNTGFPSDEDERSFRLIVPESYDGSQAYPVIFAWHWLNASSNSFVDQGELESTAEQLGVIVMLPDKLRNSNGDKAYLFDWPFAEDWGKDKELTFFDDMLSCLNAQYNIDLNRIYGIGVSAGALWLTYLSTTDRAQHLAAVVSLSGGLGEVLGVWEMSYAPQPRKFPAIVLWGGPTDWLGVDFAAASMRYESALMADDHFVVRCIHDSGHAVPPIDPPDEETTRFISLWRFMLDHPYDLEPGESPYLMDGLPSVMPEWCEIAGP